ncbi:hypothetical protein EDD22DRAFT_847332 [Suillus occidentalis]|nr:hypothetical protein EDD22DRAFT_847332 [Suillus occidentalis]
MYQELDYKNKPIHLIIQQYSKTFVDQVLLYEVSLKSSKNTLMLLAGLDKAINDDIKFYIAISVYLINVLVALCEEIKNDTPHMRDKWCTNPCTSSPYQPTVALRMILDEDDDWFMTSDHDSHMDAKGEYNTSQGKATHIHNMVENSLECDLVDVGHNDSTSIKGYTTKYHLCLTINIIWGPVVTDPVEDMDMMMGVTPVYGTLSKATGNSSNHEHEDTNGSENDGETGGPIVEVTAVDTYGIVNNNGTSNSSALSASTAVAKTMSSSHIWVPPGIGTGFQWPDPALFIHTESNTQLARALFYSIYWMEFLEGLLAEKQLKRLPPNSRIYSILNRGDGIDAGEARVICSKFLWVTKMEKVGEYVEAFQKLMSTWPEFPDQIKMSVSTENEYSFQETEVNVITFYIANSLQLHQSPASHALSGARLWSNVAV